MLKHTASKSAQKKLDNDARFAGLSGLRVTDKTPDETTLRSSFEITYISLIYYMYANVSIPVPTTVVGFDALPEHVLAYLLDRHPDQIPAKIIRLAANPADAINRFFMGLKRGHLTANDHDVQRA